MTGLAPLPADSDNLGDLLVRWTIGEANYRHEAMAMEWLFTLRWERPRMVRRLVGAYPGQTEPVPALGVKGLVTSYDVGGWAFDPPRIAGYVALCGWPPRVNGPDVQAVARQAVAETPCTVDGCPEFSDTLHGPSLVLGTCRAHGEVPWAVRLETPVG